MKSVPDPSWRRNHMIKVPAIQTVGEGFVGSLARAEDFAAGAVRRRVAGNDESFGSDSSRRNLGQVFNPLASHRKDGQGLGREPNLVPINSGRRRSGWSPKVL